MQRIRRRLRILHILRVRGLGIPEVSTQITVCRNCGFEYSGNYCPRCGQNRKTPRFSIKNALQNALSGLTNIGNGFGRNVIELLFRPGYMISDYINGKREPYFRPFPSLFVLAAIYIVLLQLIGPLEEKNYAPYFRDAFRQGYAAGANPKPLENGAESLKDVFNQGFSAGMTAESDANNLRESYWHGYADGEKSKTTISVADSARVNSLVRLLAQNRFDIFGSQKINVDSAETELKHIYNVHDTVRVGDDFNAYWTGYSFGRVSTGSITYADSARVDSLIAVSAEGNPIRREFESHLRGYPFLYKVYTLLSDWMEGNKAILIALTLPLSAVGVRWAFRRRKFNRKWNLTEHIFAQTYISAQMLLLSILYLPINSEGIQADDLYGIPGWIYFLVLWWDYTQLFRGGWRKTLKRTLLSFVYMFLIIIIVSLLLSWPIVMLAQG